MNYYVTFYSHYAAMMFNLDLKNQYNIEGKLMPVPREISSSCGTCVNFKIDDVDKIDFDLEDFEAVYEEREKLVKTKGE